MKLYKNIFLMGFLVGMISITLSVALISLDKLKALFDFQPDGQTLLTKKKKKKKNKKKKKKHTHLSLKHFKF